MRNLKDKRNKQTPKTNTKKHQKQRRTNKTKKQHPKRKAKHNTNNTRTNNIQEEIEYASRFVR